MRKAKSYQNVTKRFFRPEVIACLECGTRLRRYATLACRTIIRLDGAVRVTHCGYRCPNPACSAQKRSYRSAAADALALPGFTFGLDIVIAVGHLRLARHQTLDEVHHHLLERLSPLGLSISRREVLYLFEAYCTLLRAAQQAKEGPEWQAWLKQVEDNGGIILSIDGIQPDNGNETIYLVRDVLTGRLLCAENVTSSETEVIKALLRPVVELGVPVLAAISDAQRSLSGAIKALWPKVPHQLCQFHYLREASKLMYELDRSTRTSMRKTMQRPVRDTRDQLAHHLQAGAGSSRAKQEREQEHLQVLADYTLAIGTALNLEGRAPLEYPGIQAYDALADIDASLSELAKKGGL